MSRHPFQLTYSITHYKETEKSFAMAKQVRDKIARTDFPGWLKIESVETTFKGLMTLHTTSNMENETRLRPWAGRPFRKSSPN